ncbi:mold-specific protein ms95 [Verticillium dahliae]
MSQEVETDRRPQPRHASGLHGADSLSYTHSDASLGASTSSGLPTYEQRARSSGLGLGLGLGTGPAAVAASGPGPSLADPTLRHQQTTMGTEVKGSETTQSNPDGTVPTDIASEPSHAAAPRVSSVGQSQAKGDSKTGKLMEKAGVKLHSAKLAEKGEAKREKAAGVPV